ncbi:MAG: hypothetical protein ACYDCO_27315 [Armatimonadota bacterium]
MSQVLYNEDFTSGPGAWTCGKDREDGSWHRNLYGHRGEPTPLAWFDTGGRHGGFARSESPWYFDDNHGEFAWLHLAFFVNRSEMIGLGGADLRNAVVDVGIRGHHLALNGTRLYFWVQGGAATYNWALASQPIADALADGKWHDERVILYNDESKWAPMGLLNGGLALKIRIIHSLSVAEGSLDDILGGSHVNFGFLLCGLDPNNLPTGSIDVDYVRISVPE